MEKTKQIMKEERKRRRRKTGKTNQYEVRQKEMKEEEENKQKRRHTSWIEKNKSRNGMTIGMKWVPAQMRRIRKKGRKGETVNNRTSKKIRECKNIQEDAINCKSVQASARTSCKHAETNVCARAAICDEHGSNRRSTACAAAYLPEIHSCKDAELQVKQLQ